MNPDPKPPEINAEHPPRPRSRQSGLAATKRRGAIDRLLEAGERLIAEKGIEGVSMRQISLAAGSANHFGVQYRFGTLEGLVGAIYEWRQPQLEARRRELLAEVLRSGRGSDIRALLDALLRPIFELCDENGDRTFARVLWQVRRPGPLQFAVPFPRHSQSAALDALIRAACHDIPDQLFAIHNRIATLTFLDTIVSYDYMRGDEQQDALPAERFFTYVIDIIAAIYRAPTSPDVLADVAKIALGTVKAVSD